MTNWVWTPYLLLPTVLVVLLPEGRLPSRRWRPVVWSVVAATVVAAVAEMLRPGGTDQIATLRNPLGVDGAGFLTPLMAAASALALGAGGALCLGGLLVRQRHAAGKERAQLQWLAAGAAAATTSFVGSLAAPWPLGEVLLAIGLAALPTAIAVAAWRHQLFDVEIVLNRAVVSVALTVVGLGLYALVVVGIGDRLAPAAAACVAIVAAALWRRTEHLAGRLLFGARDDPYAVVERLGTRLDSVSAPAQALQALVETVRETLRLPYVAVMPATEEIGSVSIGAVVAGSEEFACLAGGRRVAILAVGHRHHHGRWRVEERSLLVETARRAAALVQLGGLVHELERSRNRIVAAREEERRRLRRDLHDGVASALAGIALQLDCLGECAADDLPVAIGQIRRDAQVVSAEVRALVDDLRPPALDHLGLAEAVQEHAARWQRNGGLTVRVAADPLPPLPAAPELAAYRIVTEAITNVGRHAAATQCQVNISLDGTWLAAEIVDNGTGFDSNAVAGVGLAAMRERATEVGGEFDVRSQPDHGTRITARLPLRLG